jgi:hypothetical protein
MLSRLLSLLWPKRKRRASRRGAADARHSTMRPDAGPTTMLQHAEMDTGWHHWRTPERDHDRVLSSAALAWMKKLPQPVRPNELAAAHPRVVNRIALCWSEPELIERLFGELLVDKRGNRRGFARHVADDLMRLRVFHEREFRHLASRDGETWRLQTVAASERNRLTRHD